MTTRGQAWISELDRKIDEYHSETMAHLDQFQVHLETSFEELRNLILQVRSQESNASPHSQPKTIPRSQPVTIISKFDSHTTTTPLLLSDSTPYFSDPVSFVPTEKHEQLVVKSSQQKSVRNQQSLTSIQSYNLEGISKTDFSRFDWSYVQKQDDEGGGDEKKLQGKDNIAADSVSEIKTETEHEELLDIDVDDLVPVIVHVPACSLISPLCFEVPRFSPHQWSDGFFSGLRVECFYKSVAVPPSLSVEHSPRFLPPPKPPDRIAAPTPLHNLFQVALAATLSSSSPRFSLQPSDRITMQLICTTPFDPGIFSYTSIPTAHQLFDQIPNRLAAYRATNSLYDVETIVIPNAPGGNRDAALKTLSTKGVEFLLGYFVPCIWRVNELEFSNSLTMVNENCIKIVTGFEKYLLELQPGEMELHSKIIEACLAHETCYKFPIIASISGTLLTGIRTISYKSVNLALILSCLIIPVADHQGNISAITDTIDKAFIFAKSCGAVIVNQPSELQVLGTGAGFFEDNTVRNECLASIADCKKWACIIWMVLVQINEWEISHSLGKWIDFTIKALEAGVDINGKVLHRDISKKRLEHGKQVHILFQKPEFYDSVYDSSCLMNVSSKWGKMKLLEAIGRVFNPQSFPFYCSPW